MSALDNNIPDYVAIGYICKDALPDGGYQMGGTATYSGLTAAHLGLKVGILTSAEPSFAVFENEPNVIVAGYPATATTIFENIYQGGARRQYIRALAEPISPLSLPSAWRQTPIAHLGPLAQEIDTRFLYAFDDALIGITPQGWLRCWDDDGYVSATEWADKEEYLAAADAVILSPEDVGGDQDVLDELAQRAKILVVTMGYRGSVVHHGSSSRRIPGFAAQEVDPTGAGDVFAAAYLTRLRETDDPFESARFANCVASFNVEAQGASGVPSRDQVEWRLRHGRLLA